MKQTNGTNCGEPTPRRENQLVPLVPGVVPPFCEGGSPGSRGGSQNAVVVPRVPPIGGTGNQGPGNQHLVPRFGNQKHRVKKHRCGGLVLVALDHWACALEVICDPYPLSPVGEVEALRDGRRTYQVRAWGVRYRNGYRIREKPAGTVTVLTDHICDRALPATWLQPPPAKPTPPTQEVPF